ncbi:hypothetical protein SE17_33375 [Kouleothrix aurantiaca]|uniref:Uncharacterized protein n=1 Tax=Kouleothrix aurantiaca TaxID=186479 RepID=A0A0P9EYN9_9CHLR|nr:hypothetical protein SE17_33375 [Kouleothrix aurantiaca]
MHTDVCSCAILHLAAIFFCLRQQGISYFFVRFPRKARKPHKKRMTYDAVSMIQKAANLLTPDF